MSSAYGFVGGVIAMGFAVSGLFFLRFWRRTGDLLFAAFATAFWMLALSQGLIALLGVVREERSYLFLFRLAAFVVIILAIASKNLPPRRS